MSSMTPFLCGATVDEPGGEPNLFDARSWQANVRDGGEF